MISPTKMGIRIDSAGDGHHNTPRGYRRHNGVDFLCTPGQPVYMPIDQGMIIRKAYPDQGSLAYEGVCIAGFESSCSIEIIMFYCVATVGYNLMYRQGDVIAYCQDISKKYGPPMQPHVHLRVDKVDPLCFFEEGSEWDWSEKKARTA